MHFSTTALYVILLSILEGSKTAHAFSNEDAFGISNYGYKCFDRVYPAHVIYATAKHICDKYPASKDYLIRENPLHKNELIFGKSFIDNKLEKPKIFGMIPILPDGTLYPFELKPERRLTKNSAGELVIINSGHDRLVVDKDCNIINVFTEIVNKKHTKTGRIQDCRVIKSLEDRLSPPPAFSRSLSDSYDGLPELFQEKSRDSSDLSKNIKI